MTIVDQGTIYNFFDPIEYNDLEFLGHYIIDGTFNSQNQSDPNLLRLANHKLPILTSLIKDRLGPNIPSKLPCILPYCFAASARRSVLTMGAKYL